MRAKYSPRPLSLTCRVCGAGAADVNHYGSVACYSCRAFFRRCIGEKKSYEICARGGEDCEVDQVNRTNCKKCRLAKCFKVGMKKDKVAKRKNKTRKQKLKNLSESPEILTSSTSSIEAVDEFDLRYEKVEAIDICDLAEECFLEELSQNFSIEEDEHVSSIIYDMMPEPKLTIEEEFRICEFEAAKEHLLANIWRSLEKQMPNLRESISFFLYSITMGIPFDCQKHLSFIQKSRECILNDLIFGGHVKNGLNSVMIFQNVPETAKLDTFRGSLGAVQMCIRAFMKINDDKLCLVEQRRAAGLSSLYDDFLEDIIFDKNAVPCIAGFGPFNLFQTPWAVSKKDEEYFSTTLNCLGEMVKDDVKLGTLYITLVLSTPSSEAKEQTKSNPRLLAVQQEVRLLIYRYLKNKHENTETAEQFYNKFLGLISDLYTCHKIHVFGRIQDPVPNSELILLEGT